MQTPYRFLIVLMIGLACASASGEEYTPQEKFAWHFSPWKTDNGTVTVWHGEFPYFFDTYFLNGKPMQGQPTVKAGDVIADAPNGPRKEFAFTKVTPEGFSVIMRELGVPVDLFWERELLKRRASSKLRPGERARSIPTALAILEEVQFEVKPNEPRVLWLIE